MTVKKAHPLSLPIKMVWMTLLLIGVFTYLKDNFSIYIDTQDDKCIPDKTVYLLKKRINVIERGELYAFNIFDNQYFEDGTHFGKFIVGVPNDIVDIDSSGLSINHKLYDNSLVHWKRHADKEEGLYKSYTIEPDHYFFATKHATSYDSRYYGTIEKSNVIGRLIPLW